MAASLVGAGVFGGTGLRGSAALVGYFVGASVLGRLPPHGQFRQQRGNQRDAVQVLANGAPPAAFALLTASNRPEQTNAALAAFYGSVASAAADTCATEIGTRFGGQPRSLLNGRRVTPGESGAVSIAGLVASLLAASAVGAVAQTADAQRRVHATAVIAGGLAGALADSILGATLQERRWCATCSAVTELTVHGCGHSTGRLSGVPGVNNDVVNFVAVLLGGVIAGGLSARRPKLTPANGSRVELVSTSTNSPVSDRIDAM